MDRMIAARLKDEMAWVPGGTFRMGSDKHYAEEAPAHRVTVSGFWIDRTPVKPSVPAVRQGDRPCHLRRDRAGCEGLSGRSTEHAKGGLPGFQSAEASGA